MAQILIIEDEVKIARFLSLELEHEGYIVEMSHDGRHGLELALQNNYDLILLDIMLPSLNGVEVLRRLRQEKQTPVMMLTARDQVMDKVMGLDVGADDYMTKPFAIEELLARIRVILKRKVEPQKLNENEIKIGKLEIGLDEHSVKYDGNVILLTKKEYDLLVFLAQNKNVVLTREKILSTVWGYDFFGDTNVVDVYVRYLRSKIDLKFNAKLIHTLRGSGYIMKEEQ